MRTTITRRDFLYEIGCEELPSAPLIAAIKQFGELVEQELSAAQLSHGEVRTISTPRRLAVLVADVAEQTEAVHSISRGPATRIAFRDGEPTKAAIGFARAAGIDVSELHIRRDKRGEEHVYAEVHEQARPAIPVLIDICERITAQLAFPRSQRWDAEQVSFCRPVRWLCCLFGEEVVPVRYGSTIASNITYGHRVLHPDPIRVVSPASYEEALENGCVLDAEKRRERIRAGIARVETERTGAKVDTPAKTFDEVVNLCEWPSVLVGTFDEAFLEVPHEIICESMLSHQRYFPIYDNQGKLTCEFLMVSNAASEIAQTVITGNERVVRARLDDAKFFYEADLAHPLDEFVERLSQVVFQERLGTMRDKVARIEAVVGAIARQLGMDTRTTQLAVRAAHLCKADLVSQAVIEFTSQQGVMGAYYARAQGEDTQVATAIAEHYHPRFAKDAIPSTTIGCAVAIADKLDTICGMHAINEPPTGSSDPFAQRRAAIGVIAMLRTMPSVHLEELIELALDSYKQQGLAFTHDEVLCEIKRFFMGRLSTIVRGEGIAPDTVEAVSAAGIVDPAEFIHRARALEDARAEQAELFDDLATAYARAAHLADKACGTQVNVDLLCDAELTLYDACTQAQQQVDRALKDNRYGEALRVLASLRQPIDTFFVEVLVMDKDERLRTNRLRLLNKFTEVFKEVADVGALVRKK